mmetsp:Transcript_56566/g.124032  ORF Transcript_56566/g.124032 Transcript_56566/m.124032 type:complete len:106 (+) Transcript_56566:61-378(+)
MSGAPLPNDLKKQIQRVVVKHTDCSVEATQEVLDTVTGMIDKCAGADGVKIEQACKMIKEALDKQYGTAWHCIIGKGYSFDITSQNGTLMYCFYLGEYAVLVFKC